MNALYLNLSIGARSRLASLKRSAATLAANVNRNMHVAANPTWRTMRHDSFANPYGSLCSGTNGEGRNASPIWCTHSGPQFRKERDSHDVVRLSHTGWFTDGEDMNELAIGIVAGLPHGKFLAGYRLTMNDERVYFAQIFDDEQDAARMGDEHARIIGESESEYSRKGDEARTLSDAIDNALSDVKAAREEHTMLAFALRQTSRAERYALKCKARMASLRTQVGEYVENIRANREALARDYRDFI